MCEEEVATQYKPRLPFTDQTDSDSTIIMLRRFGTITTKTRLIASYSTLNQNHPENGRFFYYSLAQHVVLKQIVPTHLQIMEGEPVGYAVSLLPDLVAFKRPVPECILGFSSSDDLDSLNNNNNNSHGGQSTRQFHEHAPFVKLFQNVIKRFAVDEQGLRSRARTIGTGWVHICDERAMTPFGRYIFLYFLD